MSLVFIYLTFSKRRYILCLNKVNKYGYSKTFVVNFGKNKLKIWILLIF